ncbi:rRNA pseudouridine synthase [Glycomyces sp. TRM65418]|uniref:pseudouridine synthase n=1 Tax=Glycomyces sp. TRM65418 TaxID=2867006 RepID=UPI001CE66E9D|nr:pseudouridine synthase [Glycomyces sp. TRM65418]MCC3761524.1 rRNA pseudouridine synthase [Glycomyces sp. TRM65418]QZD55622.1 rRNA pseudouridine synthase [Glycomyces sp. TRM65418]
MNNADAEGIRLQKVLSQAGIASRRAAEDLISRGKVKVNGEPARLGQRVDPQKDVIHVSGKRVVTDVDMVYFAINKPRGIISTMDDEEGRPSLAEFAKGIDQRVFHVGRLDTDSEGLLLLTNDGELANRIMHPSHGLAKVYRAQVAGIMDKATWNKLLKGVELEDGIAKADKLKIIDEHAGQSLIEITIHEGRKHIVRRLMDAVDHHVSRLVRTEIGPVKLRNLKPGTLRRLTPNEVGELFREVGL